MVEQFFNDLFVCVYTTLIVAELYATLVESN